MDAKRISLTIAEICQKLEIPYQSCNKGYLQFTRDVERLGQIFRDLKIIAGDLQAIAERHDINGLKDLLTDDAKAIEKIDHEIIQIAQKIKDKNELP